MSRRPYPRLRNVEFPLEPVAKNSTDLQSIGLLLQGTSRLQRLIMIRELLLGISQNAKLPFTTLFNFTMIRARPLRLARRPDQLMQPSPFPPPPQREPQCLSRTGPCIRVRTRLKVIYRIKWIVPIRSTYNLIHLREAVDTDTLGAQRVPSI